MSDCDECQRKQVDTTKPWPIYTVLRNGIYYCAKCLRPVAGSSGGNTSVKVTWND